jgi:putative endonuclease
MTDRRNTGLGEHGEKLAERHLVDQGMTVVQRRHRTRQGEIDLICRDGQTLVFVEVKTRRGDRAGAPFESITSAKQRRLTRLALTYLKSQHLLDCPARFDVVSIVLANQTDPTQPASDSPEPHIVHYRDAFPASGGGGFY